MPTKITLSLDKETIELLKLFSVKQLGTANVSGAIRFLTRTTEFKGLLNG